MSKALIAMSGGVDSSVAAKLMCDAGYECIGCTMKLFDADDGSIDDAEIITAAKTCCSADDTADARSVAMRLGMPFYAFNFKDEFREKVIDDFVCAYLCGRTPNPCIECNHYLKFDKLFDRARILGCEYIVTGHYARIEERDCEMVLLKGADPLKDQSYVLYMLSQQQLSQIRFPLGNLDKNHVREIAQENGFINAAKPDSQDICFVPDGDYASVVKKYSHADIPEGNFVDMSGKVLGRHKGIIYYTIGQRRGLGIPAASPLYVVRIDTKRNEVVLGSNDDLFSREVYADEMSCTSDRGFPAQLRCSARIRYHHKEQPGTLCREDSGFRFVFDEPQRAITAGQSIVLYDGDRVLGGGRILGS